MSGIEGYVREALEPQLTPGDDGTRLWASSEDGQLVFKLSRGIGRQMKCAQEKIPMKLLYQSRNPAAFGVAINGIIRQLQQHIWIWDHPMGAVAVVGKWRKWGRAA